MTPEEQEKLQGHNQFISAAAGLHASRKLSQTNESVSELRKLLVQKELKDEQEKDFQNRLFQYKTLFENASQTGLPLNSNEARDYGVLLIDRPFEPYLNSNLYIALDYKELSRKTAKIIADFEKQFDNYHPSVISTIRSERQKEQIKRAEQDRLLKDELVAKERFKAKERKQFIKERKQFIYDFFYGAWWFAVVPFIFITNIAIFFYQPAADYWAQMGFLYKFIWWLFSGSIGVFIILEDKIKERL